MVSLIRTGYLRERGLRAGLTTEDELEEMAKGWEEWTVREYAGLAILHGEILVQK